MQTKIVLDKLDKDSKQTVEIIESNANSNIPAKSKYQIPESMNQPREEMIPKTQNESNLGQADKIDVLNYKMIIHNLEDAVKDTPVIKDIDSYWNKFKNPESERRIRIINDDFFSKPLTLLVRNEISIQGLRSLNIVEITLIAHDGTIIYNKSDSGNSALMVTANSSYFAIVMKSGKISIYDTIIGSLIVPYNQNGNIIYISSHKNGNLGFINLNGKFTIIDVFKK